MGCRSTHSRCGSLRTLSKFACRWSAPQLGKRRRAIQRQHGVVVSGAQASTADRTIATKHGEGLRASRLRVLPLCATNVERLRTKQQFLILATGSPTRKRVSEGMLGFVVQKKAGALCKTVGHHDQRGEDTAIQAFPRLRVGLLFAWLLRASIYGLYLRMLEMRISPTWPKKLPKPR